MNRCNQWKIFQNEILKLHIFLHFANSGKRKHNMETYQNNQIPLNYLFLQSITIGKSLRSFFRLENWLSILFIEIILHPLENVQFWRWLRVASGYLLWFCFVLRKLSRYMLYIQARKNYGKWKAFLHFSPLP